MRRTRRPLFNRTASSLLVTYMRTVATCRFSEGRCFAYFRRLLPNVSTAYISYVISFPRVEIQLREIKSIPLKLHRDKSSATLTVQVRCRA